MSGELCAVVSLILDGKLHHCKPLIEVDNDATGTVHRGVSAVPDLGSETDGGVCPENGMPRKSNSIRKKGL
jgi:hypothetical protein